MLPTVNVGDTFPGGVSGILDYDFGNYKLLIASVGALTPGGLVKERTPSARSRRANSASRRSTSNTSIPAIPRPSSASSRA